MASRRQTLETLFGGVIGGISGVAILALIPWFHVTWGFAAIVIPFNAAIATIHIERKRRSAERLQLAPARAFRTP